jgi:putative drug exporter of the RND superfamily
MATLLHRLGLGAVRHRLVVTVLWLLTLIATGAGAVLLSGPTVNTFAIPGQESTTALALMAQRFGAGASGATAQVVIQAPAGAAVTDPAVAGRIAGLVGRLAGLPGVVSASNPLDPQAPVVSPDRTTALSTVSYGKEQAEITEAEREALLDTVAAGDAGLTLQVRGEAAQESGADIGGPAEGVGVVVALLVLALTYGSLVAAGMNLLTAVVGVGIGALGIFALTGFVELQSTTSILAIMLGLAVGIDYALFIVTRFRHELRRGLPVPEAAAMAVGTAGSAVVTAGLTVVIALAGLSVAGIPFLTEMGIAAAATIVIAVLVAVTLVPAILGYVGRRALPRRARAVPAAETGDGRGFIRGWARTVTGKRWPSLLLAVAALGVVAIPVASMETSLVQKPVPGSTQAKADEIIAAAFGPGFAGPLVVLVDGPGAGSYAATVRRQIGAEAGVAVVTEPRPNPAGNAALISIVPATGPQDPATTALVHRLRDRIADGPDARVYVTGETAVSIDVSQQLRSALPLYLALVVGLAFVLLVLVFRSILVPVTGVLGFLLTIGAALGATTAVFQWGWLTDVVNAQVTGPLLSLAPIIIVGILFGLAMDYQVFLVSRMHEAHAHGAAAREAVTTGFRQAAPVVIAAATIMFAVFAGFVPQGNDTIKPIAFALAVGILFDAIVVRMIAIPAALALLGPSAWWLPAWLRRLPALDVEGAALERTAPAAVEPAGARAPAA